MAYIEYPMTFKKLVQEIAEIHNTEERDRVRWEIGRSFGADKINWREHEMLYDIASRIEF